MLVGEIHSSCTLAVGWYEDQHRVSADVGIWSCIRCCVINQLNYLLPTGIFSTNILGWDCYAVDTSALYCGFYYGPTYDLRVCESVFYNEDQSYVSADACIRSCTGWSAIHKLLPAEIFKTHFSVYVGDADGTTALSLYYSSKYDLLVWESVGCIEDHHFVPVDSCTRSCTRCYP